MMLLCLTFFHSSYYSVESTKRTWVSSSTSYLFLISRRYEYISRSASRIYDFFIAWIKGEAPTTTEIVEPNIDPPITASYINNRFIDRLLKSAGKYLLRERVRAMPNAPPAIILFLKLSRKSWILVLYSSRWSYLFIM